MSICESCCYLIDAQYVRKIVGLQVDSTFTDIAAKTALDQAHELALYEWIGECREQICDTLELEENTPVPTPAQTIEFEKNNCLLEYVKRFLAFQTLAYFIQLNPNARIYGSGLGKRSVSESTVFEQVLDYKADGLSGNYSAFAQHWQKRGKDFLAQEFTDPLFPDYTTNADFFPCLPIEDSCEVNQPANTQGYFISSLVDDEYYD